MVLVDDEQIPVFKGMRKVHASDALSNRTTMVQYLIGIVSYVVVGT
jgi:hypothetical protein